MLASGLVERIGEAGSTLVHRAAGRRRAGRRGAHRRTTRPASRRAGRVRADRHPGGRWPCRRAPGRARRRAVHGPALVDDDVLAAIRELDPAGPAAQPGRTRGHRGGPPSSTPTCRRWRCSTPRSTGPCPPRALPLRPAARAGRPVRDPPVRLPRHLARSYVAAAGGRAPRTTRSTELSADHPAPGQRRQRGGGRGRPVHRHLDGADPAGRAGHGHPQRRHRPGGRVPPAPRGRHGAGRDRDHADQAERAARAGRGGRRARGAGRGSRPATPTAAEALDIFCYRVRGYVGAYAAALGRVDAIVFTAGIGENDPQIRADVCDGLQGFGVRVDGGRNSAPRARDPRGVGGRQPGRRCWSCRPTRSWRSPARRWTWPAASDDVRWQDRCPARPLAQCRPPRLSPVFELDRGRLILRTAQWPAPPAPTCRFRRAETPGHRDRPSGMGFTVP